MIPFNPDFRDLLSSFIDCKVRFLMVGGYAVAFHGHPRATKDLDVWIDPSPENAPQVLRALAAFGAPLDDLTLSDLTTSSTVFQMGVPPRRIDVICGISWGDFASAWNRREVLDLDGLQIPVIALDDLIANKRASGRLQDLADIEALLDLRAHER